MGAVAFKAMARAVFAHFRVVTYSAGQLGSGTATIALFIVSNSGFTASEGAR